LQLANNLDPRLDCLLVVPPVAIDNTAVGVASQPFAANGDVIKNQGILTVAQKAYKQIGIYTVDKKNNLAKIN
jgi:hypothetical protein